MAAVLVHIDLDGVRVHPSSLAALAAGRAAASSWGATLYAAIAFYDPAIRGPADDTGRIMANPLPAIEAVREALARGGADKVVVAVTDAPVAPIWGAVGGAWQAVLDHLRPRLVLFGADAPSSTELAPRTAARIGARFLDRVRAFGIDQVELRDRDGASVRATDGGAAVGLVGAMVPYTAGDDDIDIVVLAVPGGADPRITAEGSVLADREAARTLIVLASEDDGDPAIARDAKRLGELLGGAVIGASELARRPVCPELCIAVGGDPIELAGRAAAIRLGGTGSTKDLVGWLGQPVAGSLRDLIAALGGERHD